jgi:hypothetical protein
MVESGAANNSAGRDECKNSCLFHWECLRNS